MRSTHVIVVVVMMLLASAPSAALAQPLAQDQQQARLLFDQAESHKRKGDEHAARGEQDAARDAYGRAAEAYAGAFELYEHSAFIYNLAQMRRLRGERLRAIRAYETFLVLDPNGPQAATARTFIAQLTLELDAEASKIEPEPREPEPEPDTPPEPEPPTEPTTGPTGPMTGPNSTVPGGTSSPQPDNPLAISDTRPDPARGRGLRIAGMASMAAGAVGLGLGIKFGLDARAASRELEGQPLEQPWDRGLFERGEDAERNMAIALGAGSAAVIAGGVLYAIGVASGEGERFALQPRATPDGILVHMSGTFWAF